MNDDSQSMHEHGSSSQPRARNSSANRSKKRRSKSVRNTSHEQNQTGSNFTSQLTPAFLINVFRRWWWAVTPVGFALAVIVAAALWYTFEPVYRAAAWVTIQDRRPHIISQGAIESGRFVQTQMELVRSPPLLSSVLNRSEIARLSPVRESENPIGWITAGVDIKSIGGSDLYQIGFKDKDPEVAAKVADAIMDEYMNIQKSRSDKQIEQTIAVLNVEKKRLEEDLKEKRRIAQTRYAEVFPTAPKPIPGSKDDFIPPTSPLARDEHDLMEAEVERLILEAKSKALDKLVETEKIVVPDVSVEQAIDQLPEVQHIQSELSAKRARLKQYQQASAKGAQDAQVLRLSKETSQLEQQLKTVRDEAKPRVAGELQTAYERDRNQVKAELEFKIKIQKAHEDALKERIAEKRSKLGTDQSMLLEFNKADVVRAAKVNDMLAERILTYTTEKGAPSQVSVFESAAVPRVPMELLPYKKLAVFGMGAFLLPYFFAVLWELRMRRISEPQEITREVHLDVLGEIAVIPMRSMVPGRRADEKFERDCSTFEESIDSLRTSLMLSDELRHLQVFAVASAVSREGKTSLAAQLAISLANCCQQPTLLIDTDMRAPDLHEFFGIGLEPGLAQVLEFECSPEKALVNTWSNRVHVLPAGRLKNSPHLLLSTPVFGNILREMRTKYRYIVIDAPPVLAASEAMIVAKEADGTLVCTMRDVSRAAQLKLACNRLSNAGARLLGAVLSGVPTRAYAYKYGGYDYYAKRYRRNDPSIGHNAALQPPAAKTDDVPLDSI